MGLHQIERKLKESNKLFELQGHRDRGRDMETGAAETSL